MSTPVETPPHSNPLAPRSPSQRDQPFAQFLPKSVTVLREGYGRSLFLGDLAGGITVGVIALPLAMAFAINSGPGLASA